MGTLKLSDPLQNRRLLPLRWIKIRLRMILIITQFSHFRRVREQTNRQTYCCFRVWYIFSDNFFSCFNFTFNRKVLNMHEPFLSRVLTPAFQIPSKSLSALTTLKLYGASPATIRTLLSASSPNLKFLELTKAELSKINLLDTTMTSLVKASVYCIRMNIFFKS